MKPITFITRNIVSIGLLFACPVMPVTSISAAQPPSVPVVPAAAQQRLASLKGHARLDTKWREARDRAFGRVINPDDYECGPTDFDTWIFGKFAAIQDFDTFIEILNLGALDWPTFYSLIFDNNAADDYIGVDGRQTKEMKIRHKDLQAFWDVPTQDVQLQGMHGSDMADDAKMIPVVQFLLGVDAGLAAQIVDYVQFVIQNDSGLGFDNPLFTLNAFALSAKNDPPESPFFGLPDKIVMGDGIIEALADMGIGGNAPDMVMAHEFGHHVQFELGVYNVVVPEEELPEFTRATELMADAFGAYYCAHARGAAFQAGRIIDGLRAAHLIGDCAFDNPGHHGTPNQRQAAVEWAINLAASARKQGQINSSSLMLSLFNQQLPILIEPDAP